MKNSSKKISLLLAAILIVVCTALWYWRHSEPHKNVFGRASMERLLSECSLGANGTKIRLYRGEPGATDSFWYSVTASTEALSETQFFYTYDSPEIIGITCTGDSLKVELAGSRIETFALAEIPALIENPRGIKKGSEVKR